MDVSRAGVVLFGGPAGAGKSTLAAVWAASRERAVHIELDAVRSMIVAGLADPQLASTIAGQQYGLSVVACCTLARVYASNGYDVAVDDVLEPAAFEQYWRPELEGREFQVVIVLPGLSETLQRSQSREKRVRDDLVRHQHEASQDWPVEVQLDTTGLDVKASLALAQARGLLA